MNDAYSNLIVMEKMTIEPVKVYIVSGVVGNIRQSTSCFDYFIF